MERKMLPVAVLKKILYLLTMATFFGLLAMDNPQLLRPSRTAVVVLITYLLTAFASVYIFDGFDVGRRKLRDITNSLILSQLMTDVMAYLVLMFMNTNEYSSNVFRFSSKKLMAAAMVLHVLEILLLASQTNRLFFRVQAGQKCCVVTGTSASLKQVEDAMSSKNIVVDRVVSYQDAEAWKAGIKAAENVVLFDLPLTEREAVMEYAYKYNKNIYFNPNICDILEVTADHQMFDDRLMFYAHRFTLTFSQRLIKRTLDILVSLLMILISSPIWLVCALMIKLDDGGPVFFRQERATINGKAFRILKFRTMRASTETNPMKATDDRVTKAGRWIRKTRMDELPQLFNILKGDMSLVGPRPEQMIYIHGFDRDYEAYEYRLKVKAGLTGYAQIEGKYNTSNKDKLILDLMYIQNYSLWLDVKLMMQTLLVFFKEDSSEGF